MLLFWRLQRFSKTRQAATVLGWLDIKCGFLSHCLPGNTLCVCACVCVFDLISHKLFFHHPCNPSLEADHTPLCTEHFHSSFCSLLQHRNTFYSPWPATVMGSPLPHPGTPQVPEGHRTWLGGGVSQPVYGKRRSRAVYRKWTTKPFVFGFYKRKFC